MAKKERLELSWQKMAPRPAGRTSSTINSRQRGPFRVALPRWAPELNSAPMIELLE